MGTLLILFFIGSALVLLLLYTKPHRPHGGHSSVDPGVVSSGHAGFDAANSTAAGVTSCDSGGGGCDGG